MLCGLECPHAVTCLPKHHALCAVTCHVQATWEFAMMCHALVVRDGCEQQIPSNMGSCSTWQILKLAYRDILLKTMTCKQDPQLLQIDKPAKVI